MKDARTASQDHSLRRSDATRRAAYGVVAEYIHELSERHGPGRRGAGRPQPATRS